METNTILLVEDSDADYEATRRAFNKSKLNNQLNRCIDGEDALDYLYQRNDYAQPSSAPVPSLILLDLNMPGTDGKDVLKAIKTDKDLRHIPIIILTTSKYSEDINECYQYGANSYLQKPVNFPKLVDSIQSIENYWFELVLTPEKKFEL